MQKISNQIPLLGGNDRRKKGKKVYLKERERKKRDRYVEKDKKQSFGCQRKSPQTDLEHGTRGKRAGRRGDQGKRGKA